MAKREKENLIGHDPLSWMKENSEEGEEDMSSDNEQLTTIDREDNAPVVLQATVNIQNITDLYEKLKIVLNNNESVDLYRSIKSYFFVNANHNNELVISMLSGSEQQLAEILVNKIGYSIQDVSNLVGKHKSTVSRWLKE